MQGLNMLKFQIFMIVYCHLVDLHCKAMVSPLHPNISTYLHTVLTWRICLTIKSFLSEMRVTLGDWRVKKIGHFFSLLQQWESFSWWFLQSVCVFFFSLNIEVYVTLWISFKSSCCCLLDTEGSPKSKTDRARLGNLRAISTADTRNEEGENMDDDDKVAEYWNSDHHKFEWSNYMQSLDSRSWHALGLGVPESFLSRGQYFNYLRICSIALSLITWGRFLKGPLLMTVTDIWMTKCRHQGQRIKYNLFNYIFMVSIFIEDANSIYL